MRETVRNNIVAGITTVLLVISGCNTGPDRVHVPDFDPADIGAHAIELYDKNGDGSLSAGESKSLESAMKRADANSDGKLSADEIAARIQFYHDFKAALVPVSCTLVRAGSPLAGAKVTYEPESFMGEHALPAFGTTNSRGFTVMSMGEEHLPRPNLTGVRPGFYRIRVTLANGKEVSNLDAGAECAGDLMNTHSFVVPAIVAK